ncbi:MAG: hypothetical protein IJI05_01005 [Erysipelotrichaceae bacterium]|nr:hypothetical protein [Erysipelotrichaceae bacterium]
MNTWTIVLIVLAALSFVYEIAMSWMGKKYVNQLADLLVAGKYDEFEALTEKRAVKASVAPFNLDYIKLNSYLMRNDKEKIVKAFDDFRNKRLNKAQKVEVLSSGFNYFASNNDAERTEYYHDEINKLPENEGLKKQVNLLYDIIYLKKTDMLDELLAETEELEEVLRGSNEYLIAQIYENLGDTKKNKEYLKLAEKHMQQMADMVKKK